MRTPLLRNAPPGFCIYRRCCTRRTPLCYGMLPDAVTVLKLRIISFLKKYLRLVAFRDRGVYIWYNVWYKCQILGRGVARLPGGPKYQSRETPKAASSMLWSRMRGNLSEKALLEDWPGRLKMDLPTPDSWQIDAHPTELPVERPHVRARRSLVKMYII